MARGVAFAPLTSRLLRRCPRAWARRRPCPAVGDAPLWCRLSCRHETRVRSIVWATSSSTPPISPWQEPPRRDESTTSSTSVAKARAKNAAEEENRQVGHAEVSRAEELAAGTRKARARLANELDDDTQVDDAASAARAASAAGLDDQTTKRLLGISVEPSTGRIVRKRPFVRVRITEATVVSVLTGLVGSWSGQLLGSMVLGGVFSGLTVFFWLSLRLLHARLDLREINRRVASWDDAIRSMMSVVEAIRDVTKPKLLRYPLMLHLAVARVAHRKLLAQLQYGYEGAVPSQVSAAYAEDHLRMMKHASAAYGPLLLLLGMAEGTFGTSSRLIIERHTRTRGEDLLAVDLDGEVLLVPRHYVAIDHKARAVVLSIRGTMALSDVATDIVCSHTEYLGGIAHSGMKTSAEVLWTRRAPTVQRALQRFPDYELRIVGHSLGAGTAILLTLKLTMEEAHSTGLPPNTNVKCYAFSSPPVFSPLDKIPEHVREKISVVEYRDDCVPTMSLAAVTRLLHSISRMDRLQYDLRARLRLVARSQAPDDVVEALTAEAPGDEEGFPDLYIPGDRVWLWSSTDVRRVSDQGMTRNIILSDSMITNHFVNAYEKVLRDLANRLSSGHFQG